MSDFLDWILGLVGLDNNEVEGTTENKAGGFSDPYG